jgi:AcrR family transcriptional regulator
MKSANAPVESAACQRILIRATELFSKYGYKTVTTRAIAFAAQVNEVTVYRHFPRKHELYVAVMERAMQQVSIREDLLAVISEARNPRAALSAAFDLIAGTLMRDRDTLRFFQFSALELDNDFAPLASRHLREVVEVIARNLDPWHGKGELRSSDTRTVVLTIIAIVLSYNSISQLFSSNGPEIDSIRDAYLDMVLSEVC